MVRDVGLAEELAQDALVTALEEWPRSGIPDNPGAWLMVTARNRALDQLRRNRMLARKHEALAHELEMEERTSGTQVEARADDEIGDDLLRLIFIACHPLLSTEARTALTLKLLAGLTTEEIARAFLVPEPTIAQRIVRAKRTLVGRPRAVRDPAARGAARPPGVGAGSALPRVQRGLLRHRAARTGCGRRCARRRCAWDASSPSSPPSEAEVHGLVALMEIQASRLRARVGVNGEPVLLMDQNRALWDRLLIHRGLIALGRGQALGREARTVPAAGGDRRLPRARGDRRRHRLGVHHRALR